VYPFEPPGHLTTFAPLRSPSAAAATSRHHRTQQVARAEANDKYGKQR
jgi:hypothetical protein